MPGSEGNNDAVVRGEGEETARALIAAFQAQSPLGGVRGIACRNDGKPFATPAATVIGDLDAYRIGN
jgi:anaerobic magnesium-protoporphyrin IX monomethyl ester cyclase